MKVLVSGATGNQGGAVVNALLQSGHSIVGMTRNTESAKARNLKERGVKMVSGDFTDKATLVGIMNGVDVVFAMTTPFEGGVELETQQGITMVDAAVEAGIGHFIFNSVADADRSTGIPHFDSKYEVEKHLAKSGLNYTIVAPVYFMDNIWFSADGLKEGVLRMGMPGDIKLQQIAAEDIGRFVAHVVDSGEAMYGQRINIAGDDLTGDEAAQVLSKVTGKEIRYEGFNPDMFRSQSEDMALMYEWFIADGYTANLNELAPRGLLNFKQWASKQDWNLLN